MSTAYLALHEVDFISPRCLVGVSVHCRDSLAQLLVDSSVNFRTVDVSQDGASYQTNKDDQQQREELQHKVTSE